MIDALFTVTKDGDFEVNKPEAKKIPEYEVLFKRDKFSAGDHNGRKKLIACAEIYYIYLLLDIRSSLHNLNLVEKKERGKVLSGLPPAWKEDKDWIAAYNRYKEDFKLSASGKAYAVAERAYYTIANDTEELQEELITVKELVKDKLKKLKSRNTGDMELIAFANEVNGLTSDILKNQKQIMDNIKQFASMQDIVKNLAYKFIEEGGSLKIPIGGGELNEREI